VADVEGVAREGKVDAGWLRGWKKDGGRRRDSCESTGGEMERKIRFAGVNEGMANNATREIIFAINDF